MSRTVVLNASAFTYAKGTGDIEIPKRGISLKFENALEQSVKIEMLKNILGINSANATTKPGGIALFCYRNTTTDDQKFWPMNPHTGVANAGDNSGSQQGIANEDYSGGSGTAGNNNGYLRKFGRILTDWNVCSGTATNTTNRTDLGHMLVGRDTGSNGQRLSKSWSIYFQGIAHGFTTGEILEDNWSGWSNGYKVATSGTRSTLDFHDDYTMIANSSVTVTDSDREFYLLTENEKGILVGAYLIKGANWGSTASTDSSHQDTDYNLNFSDHENTTGEDDVTNRSNNIFSGKNILPTTGTLDNQTPFDATDTVRGKYTIDFSPASTGFGFNRKVGENVYTETAHATEGFTDKSGLWQPDWGTMVARDFYPTNGSTLTTNQKAWKANSQADVNGVSTYYDNNDEEKMNASVTALQSNFSGAYFDMVNSVAGQKDNAYYKIEKWALMNAGNNRLIKIIDNPGASDWTEVKIGDATYHTNGSDQATNGSGIIYFSENPRFTVLLDFGIINESSFSGIVYAYNVAANGSIGTINTSTSDSTAEGRWIGKANIFASQVHANGSRNQINTVNSTNGWSGGNRLKIQLAFGFQTAPTAHNT